MTDKWFDREFDFSFGMERYDALIERLQNVPSLFKKTVASLPEYILQVKPENKWSVKENIGHLLLLEPLWRIRFREIKENKSKMSTADLSNTATNEASFNKMQLTNVLENFMEERDKTTAFLNSLKQEDFAHSIIHPRLQQPMRVIDLMFFVAEHDSHHLNTIRRIIKSYNNERNNGNTNI